MISSSTFPESIRLTLLNFLMKVFLIFLSFNSPSLYILSYSSIEINDTFRSLAVNEYGLIYIGQNVFIFGWVPPYFTYIWLGFILTKSYYRSVFLSLIVIFLIWSSFSTPLTIPQTNLIVPGHLIKKLWLDLALKILDRCLMISTKVPPKENTLQFPKSIMVFQV